MTDVLQPATLEEAQGQPTATDEERESHGWNQVEQLDDANEEPKGHGEPEGRLGLGPKRQDPDDKQGKERQRSVECQFLPETHLQIARE